MSHLTTRVLFLSRLFVALTLGLAFAHVLETLGKWQLSAADWLMVQQHLYVGFGTVGAVVEVLAILLTWIGWFLARRSADPSQRIWTLAAAVVITIGLIEWALVVSPMNAVLNRWTPATVPPEWTRVRNRWEIGHAIQAALFALAFVLLEIGTLRIKTQQGSSTF